MKGSYGDDYSAVGLLAGGGSYLTWVFPGKMGIRRLQSSSSPDWNTVSNVRVSVRVICRWINCPMRMF